MHNTVVNAQNGRRVERPRLRVENRTNVRGRKKFRTTFEMTRITLKPKPSTTVTRKWTDTTVFGGEIGNAGKNSITRNGRGADRDCSGRTVSREMPQHDFNRIRDWRKIETDEDLDVWRNNCNKEKGQ